MFGIKQKFYTYQIKDIFKGSYYDLMFINYRLLSNDKKKVIL